MIPNHQPDERGPGLALGLVGIEPLADGICAGSLLLLATLLLVFAGKGRDETMKRPLAFAGVAALILALSFALDSWGIQAPALKLLVRLAACVAICLSMLRLPRWLAALAQPEARTLVEEKLKESDHGFRTLADAIPQLCWMANTDGSVFWFNQRWYDYTGTTLAQMEGWGWKSVHDPKVLPRVLEHWRASIDESKPFEMDVPLRGGDGLFRPFLTRVMPVFGRDGKVTRWFGTNTDITERLEAEARLQAQAIALEAQMAARTVELQESEARLQGFIRHAPAAIAFKGLDGRLLLVNRRAEAMMGLDQAATMGRRLEDIFPPELAAKVREEDERVLAHREEIQKEEALTLPDGSTRHFLIQKFPLIDATGHCWGLGGIATDITERKQAERADLQRQKLESLGLLASGIAHDFNNLLGAMAGNLELLRSGLADAEPVETMLETLEQLFDRAASLVAQILAYSGKGKFQVQALDLNLQVEEITRIMRASLSRRASLQWQPAPGLPSMEGDLGQIQQVIMNLVLNASEAMDPKGGVITIRTGKVDLTRAAIDRDFKGQALRPGPHLQLEVADNGPGMAAEVQERIFEPFFTTKFTGRGLGLSAVQGILRSHQGGIQVQSREGEGTTFRLLFPASSGSLKAAVAPSPSPERAPDLRGAGTVLVVDDEDALRSVAVIALQRQGYETLEARDGLEALQVYEANQSKIRLILMDLTMPRMDGDEAYRELRRGGAMVPIVLASGFGEEEALQRFRNQGLAGFLPKPYRIRDLLQAVHTALEGPKRQEKPA